MADIATPSFDKNYDNLVHNNDEMQIFNFDLSEQDVLHLQEIFLTCGVHTIKTTNVATGRKILESVVGSLKYYQNIGIITHENGVDTKVYDILRDIKNQGLMTDNIIADLEDFFMVHTCFDFVWVEFSQLLSVDYAIHLQNIFTMYYAQERMPVIFVMYDQL
ncbi:hypothetical protein [Candidatus Chromulinivorax destructor]|uniref:Uncharacterized protein n=1 Tax=Candidatus Chromulinivorax destructor TaxID=2066483 RepID=A0A345ZAA8_9BACT|nr:hypothetical protein [Candidatus Chromulinivorax destructor]AXK60225.1 hypothetical protein C0J27_00470 [Candidatus Chromulinivorax destructor]